MSKIIQKHINLALQTSVDALNSPTQSKAASGYVTLPGGVIVQWGVGTFGMAATSEATGTLTFPLAFPTACRSVTFTPNFSVAGGSVMYATSVSATTASLQRSNNANADSGTSFFWTAVGY